MTILFADAGRRESGGRFWTGGWARKNWTDHLVLPAASSADIYSRPSHMT
jgi:hypothetical protein